jgi:deoxyribodipyrimidine photo-lyase
MSNLILFWHRRDLRIADNLGLAAARDRSAKLVGVFCLDPNILQRDDVAPARVAYLIGCLQDLQNCYRQAGSQLLVLHTDPIQGIPALAQALQAAGVFWNSDVEPYAQQRDRAVQEALQQQSIPVQTFWDQLLHAPEQIRTGAGEAYTVYTPFWRNWISKDKPKPGAALTQTEVLTAKQEELATQAGVVSLPSAQALGFDWPNPLFLEPGATAAQQRLEAFCQQAISAYGDQRNIPAEPGTSGLSAALKFGAIGIRTVWAATQAAWAESRSDEARESIQTWQKELAWREFYQQPTDSLSRHFLGKTIRDSFRLGARAKLATRLLMQPCANSIKPAGCTTAAG